MDVIDQKTLINLLVKLTEDARFVICEDTFDPVSTDENIENMIKEIDTMFIVELREHD